METVRSVTLRDDNRVAVRLPEDVAFGIGTEVVIVRSGDVMTIYPARMTVAEMVARLAEMPRPGAIEARDQGEVSERAE
ncbi:MAG: hypothetical protein KDA64_18200 [Rhodospirillaceae bacterium]|nr:hypothetical protein [Rhodospirillaceae bacterium]